MLDFVECASREDLLALRGSELSRQRHALEEHIAGRHEGEDAFFLPGFCLIDEVPVDFRVDQGIGVGDDEASLRPNWRESLLCGVCGLNNRQRAIASALERAMEKRLSSEGRRVNLYMMEQVTRTYDLFSSRNENVVCVGSEYLSDEFSGGTVVGGLRHENAEQLSFVDGSFDFVLSAEVLEHVNSPQRAIAEIHRVLRPGGELFLSIPFDFTRTHNSTRARIENGDIVHLAEPAYHGNPLSADGSLVFTDFGWEFVEEIGQTGFESCRAQVYWSFEYGHLGPVQFFLHAVKPMEAR